uniref:Cuticlin-1 n=1 Tax=Bactrocera latifrons TaxID=174628 RepID=A0A0K8UC22_BACLA
MFLRRCTIYLIVLLLVASTASAARKTKRPVKPAKTYPRNNITPAPPAAPAAAVVAGASTGALAAASVAAAAPQVAAVTTPAGGSSTTHAPQSISSSSTATPTQIGSGNYAGSTAGDESTGSDGFVAGNELPKPMTPLSEASTGSTGAAAASASAESKTDRPAATLSPIEEDCDPDMIGFEIITGYVLSAPTKLLDTLPGILMLTDCLEACQANESCSAVNYETGLCVLFRTTADVLPGSLSRSQFPVFTIYAQKSCLGVRPCSKAWCIDRVQGYRLVEHVKSSQTVYSRRDCLELCLGETEFTCRSANFYRHSGLCELSDMDRITLTGANNVEPYDGADYLENNCAEEPSKLCEFKRISGKILKTVDSVYQDINSIDECRDLCLNSPYRCHSYDYNDTGDMVCRLSHHSRATLTDVLDPYLDVPEAATYELSSCYNVSIECRSGEMITKIRTSKLFDGKVYAKGSPKSCSVNVNNSLEFDFRMGYNDLECNVRQSAYGRYMNDIVIQHHDMIVTSSDLGLAVSCQYDLTNKTVSNDVDLGVTGEIESSLSEEIIIDSPNVIMKITSRDGSDMKRIAEVGDPLALRFEIVEQNSPYEIFVRELVAMDGTDNAEITLIDANGCPTDQYIMGAIQKMSANRKVLVSQFDAFKFPSSEVVQFRALVTPCIPRCEPVICDNEDAVMGGADAKSLVSYGRRRRSVANGTDGAEFLLSTIAHAQREKRDVSGNSNSKNNNNVSDNKKPAADDNILLVQSIQITDKFGFNQEDADALGADHKLYAGIGDDALTCLNGYGLIVAGALFLLAQFTIFIIWKTVQKRSKKERYLYQHESAAAAVNYGAPTMVYGQANGSHCGGVTVASHSGSSNASDTLGKLYDSGMTGRYGQQY